MLLFCNYGQNVFDSMSDLIISYNKKESEYCYCYCFISFYLLQKIQGQISKEISSYSHENKDGIRDSETPGGSVHVRVAIHLSMECASVHWSVHGCMVIHSHYSFQTKQCSTINFLGSNLLT